MGTAEKQLRPPEPCASQIQGILHCDGLMRWHVLHTQSRQEKSLGDDLQQLGIGYFLPLVSRVQFYGKRKKTTEVPLFSGYVFLLGTLDQAYSADRTGRVAKIIPVFDQEKLDWDLRNLQLAMRQNARLDPHPALRAGVRVEVGSGPFRGLQGVVEHRAEYSNRLVLQIEMLGRAVSLEIDASLLDLLD